MQRCPDAPILIVQRALPYYRGPVLQALNQRFSGGIVVASAESLPNDLTPLGADMDVPTLAIKVRQLRFLGNNLLAWLPGLSAEVERLRPAAVVSEGNPRILTTWGLPRLCTQLGVASVLWTKGPDGRSGLARRRLWSSYLARWDAVAVYGQTARLIVIERGVPVERVFVAQNAVPVAETPDDWQRLKQRANELRQATGLVGVPLVVSLGRLTTSKRIDDAIRAFVRARAQGLEAVLCIVGVGSEERKLKRLARAMAGRAGIGSESIRFIGLAPPGMDAVWLAAADVAVFTGGVGLGLNVSLGAGTATVIADESGSDAELLINDETGLRFPKGDVNALSRAIARLLGYPDSRSHLGSNGRRLILERATVNYMADGLEAAIRHSLRVAAGRCPAAD